jgi:tetratricopeptide (TPR) repeat protein
MFKRIAFILGFYVLVSAFAVAQTDTEPTTPLSEEVQRAYFQATQHLIKGDLDKAYSSFTFCSDEERKVSAFHFELGKIDLQLSRFESSLMHFDNAIKLDYENSWYFYYRAQTLLSLEDYDSAWLDLIEWVKVRPGDLEALEECSESFLRAGQTWHAFQLLSYYEDMVVKNVDVRKMRLALTLSSTVPIDNIEGFVDDAVKDFPNEPVFLHKQALFSAYAEDFARSIKILEALRKSHPYFMESALSLAESYTAVGRTDEAFDLLLLAFKSDEVNSYEKLEILIGYKSISHPGSEVEVKLDNLLYLALHAHPDESNLLHFAGLHWIDKGELRKAVDALKKVIVLKPNSIEAFIDCLGAIYSLRDFDDMVAVGTNAVEAFPLEGVFYLFVGIAHKEKKQYSKAKRHFKNGLGVIFDAPELAASISSELAFVYREMGEKEKSYNEFEKSLNNFSNPFVMNNHAYFLGIDEARLDDALAWSTLANELLPLSPNFMDTQALVLHLSGRNDEALIVIREARNLLPENKRPDAVFLEREGDILWSLELYNDAYTIWKEAITAGGGAKRLNEKLATVPVK